MIKHWMSFSAFAVSSLVSAQDLLGTKADPVSKPQKFDTSGPGLMPLFQTILVLGVVLFLLKLAAPKLLAMFGKKMTPKVGGQILIEESATFAGGSLYVVQARGKSLLLSANNNGVTCLADLTQDNVSKESEPLFMEIVADEVAKRGEDTTPAFAVIEVPEETEAEITPEPEAPNGPSLLRNAEIEALRTANRRNA